MLIFKRKTAINVQLPDSFLGGRGIFGITAVGFPKGFEFRRRKNFAEVWLHFQRGLRLNLTEPRADWPKDFRAARVWAQRFSDAHGFTYREVTRRGEIVARTEGENK